MYSSPATRAIVCQPREKQRKACSEAARELQVPRPSTKGGFARSFGDSSHESFEVNSRNISYQATS
jgi:hypothetical protein